MSIKSRADLATEIGNLLADNTTGDVSLGDFRTVLIDIIDSCLNTTSDAGTTGAYIWSGATQYYTNQIINYLGNWYVANKNPALTGAFDPADWDIISNNLFKATLSLTAAQVKLLNTTPQTIVPAVSGKSIVLISSQLKITYGTVAFATDTSPYIYTDTATIRQADFPTVLNATTSRTVKGVPYAYVAPISATDTQLINNKALKITCAANPTAGDSTVEVTVFYTLI